MENIYIRLTGEFNHGRLRAIICSGQAAVLHRIAIMSKDGDWIIREDDETTRHLIGVLAGYKANYRFGAPLDIRWLAHGWSSHFEFNHQELRIRADFFSRPPRLTSRELHDIWSSAADQSIPVVSLKELAKIKQTNREKDYVVIGEIARRMNDPADQILFSRSAIDLMGAAGQYPELVARLAAQRPLLAVVSGGREQLEAALDAERRALIHANEKRLAIYRDAAQAWLAAWPEQQKKTQSMPLDQAHSALVRRATALLPMDPVKK